jgi:hypothetical protein
MIRYFKRGNQAKGLISSSAEPVDLIHADCASVVSFGIGRFLNWKDIIILIFETCIEVHKLCIVRIMLPTIPFKRRQHLSQHQQLHKDDAVKRQ